MFENFYDKTLPCNQEGCGLKLVSPWKSACSLSGTGKCGAETKQLQTIGSNNE